MATRLAENKAPGTIPQSGVRHSRCWRGVRPSGSCAGSAGAGAYVRRHGSGRPRPDAVHRRHRVRTEERVRHEHLARRGELCQRHRAFLRLDVEARQGGQHRRACRPWAGCGHRRPGCAPPRRRRRRRWPARPRAPRHRAPRRRRRRAAGRTPAITGRGVLVRGGAGQPTCGHRARRGTPSGPAARARPGGRAAAPTYLSAVGPGSEAEVWRAGQRRAPGTESWQKAAASWNTGLGPTFSKISCIRLSRRGGRFASVGRSEYAQQRPWRVFGGRHTPPAQTRRRAPPRGWCASRGPAHRARPALEATVTNLALFDDAAVVSAGG